MSVKSAPMKIIIMTQLSLTWMSCDGGEWKLKIEVFFECAKKLFLILIFAAAFNIDFVYIITKLML